MHHSTQSAVMEGVLAGTVTLGVCKSTCDLLSLPSVGASLNSVCFCSGCLLIFTDLTVTAFLALLWLAEHWLPPFPVPSDVITLRFLLFLGHTYGAVLLLTVPLIAMETACKLLLVPAGKSWADRGGPHGGGREGRREGERVETGGGWSTAKGDTVTGERAEVVWRFLPVPGFLCCLLAWALCGLWGGRCYMSAQLEVEACVLRTGSLSSCLPDLATIARSAGSDPWLTLPAVLLLLTLPVSLSMLRRGWALPRSPWATVEKEAPRADIADAQPCVPQDTPNPAAVCHSPCPSMELDRGQSPNAICYGRVNRQMHSDPWQQSSVLRAQLLCTPCGPAGPRTHTRSSCRTLGLNLLAGLLCAAALYLLPPCLAVNTLLISSVGSLAERSLRH
ncbi:hypothetical protein COCON_G00181120 [Conger conger]|uniref:Uncharacterized protein n=1 Tax=Conger conger TaxID=82655 RepID=A0A9Q1D5G2_CONCO|nr:hypothetical protein COCON_G00181120 [Conger conger]